MKKASLLMTVRCMALVGFCVLWQAPAYAYRVRRGEWIGDIARHRLEGPAWGPNGNAYRIIKLNPHLTNPDLVLPGEEIVLPDDVAPRAKRRRRGRQGASHAARTRRARAPRESTPAAPADDVSAEFTAPESTAGEGKSSRRRRAIAASCPPPPPCPVAPATFSACPACPPPPACPVTPANPAGPQAVAALTPAGSQSATPSKDGGLTGDTPGAVPSTSADAPAPRAAAVDASAPQADASGIPGDTGDTSLYGVEHPAHTGAVNTKVKLPARMLTLAPFMRLTQLQATDRSTSSEVQLVSQAHAGIDLQYTAPLFVSLATLVRLQVAGLMFSPPDGARNALVGRSHVLAAASLGLTLHALPMLDLALMGTYGNMLFSAQSSSTTAATIATVALPGVLASADLTLYRSQPWQMGLTGLGGLRFGGSGQNYTVRSGTQLGGGIFATYRMASGTVWRADANLQSRSQDTSLVSQTDNSVGIAVGVTWPLLGDD